MAVQQNKKSRSRKGMRRSHDRVATPTVIYCSCGEGESTTDLVFSGHHLICEDGTVLASAFQCVPQLRRLQGPSGDRQDRS